MKSLVAMCLLLNSAIALAEFMPSNKLHLEINTAPTMTEAQFNAQIDKAEAFYKPLVKDTYNRAYTVNRLWNDDTVNASAYQQGAKWYINMYGGLARRVTQDAFLAVICHETGHHLGGFPFTGYASWAANEGSADYFATQNCLRVLLEGEDNGTYAAAIPAFPKAKCDAAWSALDDRNLCYRVMLAGKNLADLLSDSTAKYDTPDPSRVNKTNNNHPQGQCRLDTYMNGALCKAVFDKDIIPGKDLGNQRNSRAAEQESAKYTCSVFNGDKVGLRPNCWFKSQK